jgi:hypothetical protein
MGCDNIGILQHFTIILRYFKGLRLYLDVMKDCDSTVMLIEGCDNIVKNLDTIGVFFFTELNSH